MLDSVQLSTRILFRLKTQSHYRVKTSLGDTSKTSQQMGGFNVSKEEYVELGLGM